MNTIKNSVATKKANSKKGVTSRNPEKVNTTSKKTPSKLTIARREVVKTWNEENLKPSKICDFFNSDLGKISAQKFVNEVNNSFNTTFKLSSLNKSLLHFGYVYEKNLCELNAKKDALIVKSKKEYFSPNYILTLLQRKAKFGNAKNEDFIKYSAERVNVRIDKIISDKVRNDLKNRLYAEHQKNNKK